jgi:hypothetical protein
MLLVPGEATASAGPYIPVFALEAGLLALALIAAWPLMRRGVDRGNASAMSNGIGSPQDELAGTKA